jgi:hypothetical protein
MSRDPNKLRVFHLADALILDIYKSTKDFPAEEAFWSAGANTPRGGLQRRKYR